MRACVCVPRDLSDEGLLCVCMCVLKHVPKRICMCAHACVRALACIMSGVGGGGECACVHHSVCAICIYNEFCVCARTSGGE